MKSDSPHRSHDGALAASYVRIEDDEAAALAQRVYGLTGRFFRYATEKDDTFRIDGESGHSYVMKVANPGESEMEIDLQISLLTYLERVAPDLPIPRVFPSKGGELLLRVATSHGEHRYVRLLSHLPGKPLARSISTPCQRERIGELLAQLRHATSSFSHPAEGRPLAWDVQHLLSLRDLLQEVPAEQRVVLKEAMERFRGIKGRLQTCRTQVLHNDFNADNILVSQDNPDVITGIIDFGDTVRTAVAIDVSTAMMNQFPREEAFQPGTNIFSSAQDVLRGYLRHADLTAEELELIPHLAMGRVVARALLTTWRAKLFPSNASYILRNTGPGWAQLDWFLQRTPDEISAHLLPLQR